MKLTVTPVDDDVELLSVGARMTNRDTNNTQTTSDSVFRPDGGDAWVPFGGARDVAARRVFELGVVVAPEGKRARMQVEIGGVEVFNEICRSGSWPMTGRFKLTTF